MYTVKLWKLIFVFHNILFTKNRKILNISILCFNFYFNKICPSILNLKNTCVFDDFQVARCFWKIQCSICAIGLVSPSMKRIISKYFTNPRKHTKCPKRSDWDLEGNFKKWILEFTNLHFNSYFKCCIWNYLNIFFYLFIIHCKFNIFIVNLNTINQRIQYKWNKYCQITLTLSNKVNKLSNMFSL